jgi:hypothetical protein
MGAIDRIRIRGQLQKELGRDPTDKEIQDRFKKGGGAVKTHPLTGKPAGRYKVDGKIVNWDGQKEL